MGSFCDPAWDICLTSFIIMGRRGRPSTPHHLPSPHHPTATSQRAEPSKQSRANLFISPHVSFCICASVYVCYGIHTYVHIHTRAPFCFYYYYSLAYFTLIPNIHTQVLYDFVSFRVHARNMMFTVTDDDDDYNNGGSGGIETKGKDKSCKKNNLIPHPPLLPHLSLLHTLPPFFYNFSCKYCLLVRIL